MKVLGAPSHSTVMRALALMLVVVGSGGCLLDANKTLLGPDCTQFQLPLDRMIVAGEESTLQATQYSYCKRGITKKPTKAVAHVKDAEGTEVTATVGELTTLGLNNAVPVTFTPTHAGPWVLEVAFEPGLGSVRYEVQAVAIAHPPEQVVAWSGPTDCVQLAVTSKQTLLCMRYLAHGDAQIRTSYGEELVGVAFERDGDALWVLSKGGLIERRVDDGAAFTVTHHGTFNGFTGPLAAQGGDVWVPNGLDQLTRVHPEADGTFSTTSLPRPKLRVDAIAGNDRGLMLWTTDPDPNHPAVLFVDPAGVAQTTKVSTPNSTQHLQAADGDLMWVETEFWNDVDHIQRVKLAVKRISGPVNAPLTESDLEFSQHIELPYVSSAVFGSAPPVLALSARGQGNVALHPRVAVTKFDGTTLSLETYPVGDGFDQIHSATRTHAFAFALDGKSVKIFTRN